MTCSEPTREVTEPGHRFMFRLGKALKQALFPARCMACTRLFQVEHTHDGTGAASGNLAAFFCSRCRDGFTPIRPPLCPACGVMFHSRNAQDHLCGDCLRAPRPFGMARSAGAYGGSLRTAIHRFKYGGHIELARPLGRWLAWTFHRHWLDRPVDAILPVPLHMDRFRQRGFNQAHLLIRRWDQGPDGNPTRSAPVPSIRPGALERHRRTLPQSGLDKPGRAANVDRAFRVGRGFDPGGLRILLVDDVMTTGATAEACTRVLLAAGARSVDVLTLARAL